MASVRSSISRKELLLAKKHISKEIFVHRVKEALQKHGYPTHSPATFARNFNSRYPGPPISTEAARRWLEAESMPAEDKVMVVAKWLDLPADYLFFEEASKAA